ncbi:methyltransferase [Cladophialophora carrionii]|uniref:Methyltransferase n=1 Tax=Cladophialophora carrionii TaxID=86049 RepID=A0A1C1CZP5_9EURO|nr:methyltransferase [Cladophialophora carrionii]
MSSSTTDSSSAPIITKEKTFSTYNVEQGKHYAQTRRDYHPKVYEAVLDHHTSTGGQLDTLLDVGCGPGNVTASLAPYFAHAIGIDPSEGMLTTARATTVAVRTLHGTGSPIRFDRATAETLLLPGGTAATTTTTSSGSADLITAANAAHWFDMPGFWRAAARVLKPGGTVAIWTSGPVHAHPTLPNARAIDAAMLDHRERHLAEYMTPGNLLVLNSYRDLPLPWTIAEAEAAAAAAAQQDATQDQSGHKDGDGDPDDHDDDDMITALRSFDKATFRRVDWDPATPFFVGETEGDLDTFESMLGTGSAETRWRQAHPELVGTERDVVRMLRREIERLLHEAGVEKGRERVKGTVYGALLFVKKKNNKNEED